MRQNVDPHDGRHLLHLWNQSKVDRPKFTEQRILLNLSICVHGRVRMREGGVTFLFFVCSFLRSCVCVCAQAFIVHFLSPFYFFFFALLSSSTPSLHEAARSHVVTLTFTFSPLPLEEWTCWLQVWKKEAFNTFRQLKSCSRQKSLSFLHHLTDIFRFLQTSDT